MRRHRPPVHRVTGIPNSFETFLLVACVVQGIGLATGAARSGVVDAALEGRGWLAVVWAALLGVGGMASLLGLYWRGDPFTAVEVKRVGLVMVGFGSLVYGAALVLAAPETGFVAGVSAIAFSVAAFTRVSQVSGLLEQARRDVEKVRGDT